MNLDLLRKVSHLGIASLLCFPAALVAGQSDHNQSGLAGDATQAVSIQFERLEWHAIVPELGSDSPQIAILRVDPQTQATQLLIRTPKKMHVPSHWHTANETHVMIRGTAVFEHDGKREQLGPGGFNFMPNKMPHQAWTSDDSLILITVDGAWDVNWAGNPPGKADVGQIAPTAPEESHSVR